MGTLIYTYPTTYPTTNSPTYLRHIPTHQTTYLPSYLHTYFNVRPSWMGNNATSKATKFVLVSHAETLRIQMFIKVASYPRLSGIGMPSPILWSHPLKMQRIVLLSSLLWWELGTNSLITGPGEWLSFRRFTSKLSWSWSWTWSWVQRKHRLLHTKLWSVPN